MTHRERSVPPDPTMTATECRAVIVGIGNEYRGDDGIGPLVAARLDAAHLPGVRVRVCDGEPTRLLDLWGGADLAVVVDAVLCRASTPGSIRRITGETLREVTVFASSHALGISEAVRLGRVLGRLPPELVVIAVEAACFDLGAGLSEPVTEAIPDVLRTVRAELTRWRNRP
jgi:hydrogenase maturation protease